MAYPWFRMYSEFATDPKVQRLPECIQRRFIMLLCLRCSNGDVTLQDDDVAFQLRITDQEWAETKDVLIDKMLIGSDNRPLNWEKRQRASDTSNERVRRHRELKKTENATGNTDVTLQIKNVTKCNALDKESDIDSERDKDNNRASALSLSSSFAQSAGITLPPDEPLPPRKSPYRTNLTHESNYDGGALVESFMSEDEAFKPPAQTECEQWFHDRHGRKDVGTEWWKFWAKRKWKGFVDWKVNAEIDAPEWISRENQFAQEKANNQKPTVAAPTKKTTDDGLRIAEESGKIQAVPPPADFLKLREKIGRSIPA